MALPIKVHCERCGLPQWLPSRQAERVRSLVCPRCGHRAAAARVRAIRERARDRLEPELKLAS
jgi:DNA-directed RNA polymerase subunit RPC12/RpoP